MTILVTGGAGYIGSHVGRLLQQQGQQVTVIDNLSSGNKARIGAARLIELDLAAQETKHRLVEILREDKVDSVIHFAARKQVGESVLRPEWYFQQNIGGLANLLEAMHEAHVQKLVFSSSAATYGMPDVTAVTESTICNPINPYGQTKLIGEWMVSNAAKAWGLRGVNLRYFNVAGAGWSDLADTAEMNLVPIVFAKLAAGEKPIVFGDDYATDDGSCVRDYVHVLDIAEAHLAALEYTDLEVREFETFNVGTGVGSSVFEVIDAIRKVSGKHFDIEVKPRRAGDPPFLCADVSRIKNTLGWKAKSGLSEIIQSAWSARS
jgi:UDP-glucose 4-epimerase